MQQKRLAAGLLAAFAAFTNAEGESDVASLTKDTFADFIKANDLVLAECKPSPTLPPPLDFSPTCSGY